MDRGTFRLLVIAVSVLITVIRFIHDPNWTHFYGVETYEVAKTIACCNLFGNPFQSMPTGSTAIVPPLWPAILGLAIRLGAVSPLRLVFVCVLLNGFGWGLALSYLPHISERLTGNTRAGYLGAAFGLLPIFPVVAEHESALAAGVLAFVVAKVLDHGRPVTLGLLTGLLALLQPIAALLAAFPAWIAFARPSPKRVLVFMTGVLLVTVPWCIRNHISVGVVSFVRDNWGLELWASNHEGVAVTQREGMEAGTGWNHPNVDPRESVRFRALGERAYIAEKEHEALRWITANPITFLVLTGQRAYLWWFPVRWHLSNSGGLSVLLSIMAVIGLLSLRDRALLTVGVIVFCFPLPYYVMASAAYFRTPILWVFAFLAAFAAERMLHLFAVTYSRSQPRRSAGSVGCPNRSAMSFFTVAYRMKSPSNLAVEATAAQKHSPACWFRRRLELLQRVTRGSLDQI